MGVTNPGSFLQNIPDLCDKAALHAEGTPCEDVFNVTTSVEAAPAGSRFGDGFHWLLSRWFGTSLAGCVII